jgi:hypothetical protein
MNRPKSYLLTSPVYVAAVALLLLNDFALKPSYPCWMTGKLSDFTGLFSFCVLALIIWPHGGVLLGIALSFAFWKSPFSQPLITSWNTLTGCLINRTIDYTDLFALSMIPAAWIFFESAKPVHIRMEWRVASCCASLFAFAATSQVSPEQRAAYAAAVAEYKFSEHQPTYSLPFTRKELYQRIKSLGFFVYGTTGLWPNLNKHSAYAVLSDLPKAETARRDSTRLFEAMFDFENTAAGVVVRVTKLEVKRGRETIDAAAAVKMFEERVIAPLRAQARSPQTSTR